MSDHVVKGSASSFDALAAKIRLTTSGRRFLDVDAGAGGLVLACLRQGIDAQGVGLSLEAIAEANAIAPGRFHYGSVSALPFDAHAFDTVVAADCLDQLDENEVAPAIDELARVGSSALYVKVSPTCSAGSAGKGTFRNRKWWEDCFFKAGFRKHPAYYQISSYESLENKDAPIELLLERIPAAAALKYPLDALLEERDLHMDMFRESGSRSDAHVMRYQWAAQYIRPGDVVLDAACGLGYGSYLLQSCSAAKKTIGIDGSDFAVDYALANYAACVSGLDFRVGMLPQALAEIPDASVDVVVSFETLEHVQDNLHLLAEFQRVLTPGGRIVASVPNDWSDESGEDPNPFHLHVYTLERLRSEMAQYFVIEALAAQDADQHKAGRDRKQWQAASRSLKEVPLSVARIGQEPCAEWWLSVAMKTPIDGAKVGYREANYPVFTRPDWNVTTFARDYSNPWLVRSMVDTGHRLRDTDALVQLAQSVVEQAPPDAPDVGAALCVMAYQLLNAERVQVSEVTALEGRINAYLGGDPATPHGVRWRISLLFVLGKLWMAHGDFERGERAWVQCVMVDPLSFSPLLCNRTVEAWLELGLCSLGRDDLAQAEQRFREGIRQARRAVVEGWDAAMGDVENPAEFSLPELASILELASSCAFALANLKDFSQKTWWWLHPRRDRLSQSRELRSSQLHALTALRASRNELQNYALQAQVFTQQIAAAHSAASAAQTVIAERERELQAYRLQAEEFARQVSSLQEVLECHHAEASAKEKELVHHGLQAEEFARQVSSLQEVLERHHAEASAKEKELVHHRQQAAALQLRVETLGHTLEQSQALLMEKDAEVLSARRQASEAARDQIAAQREVGSLSEKVEALESQVALIKSTRAWRVISKLGMLSDGRSSSGQKQERDALSMMPRPKRSTLPEDFDSEIYFQLNPDVRAAGMDAAEHYQSFGWLEGRHYLPPRTDSGVEVQAELTDLDVQLQAEAPCPPDAPEVAAVVCDPPSAPSVQPTPAPADFDAGLYLKLNPDVAVAGLDPVAHYVAHGAQEGRAYRVPALELVGEDGFKAGREVMLLVSHEASRTGAPILSLNLSEAFSKKFNVVVLLLGGGALQTSFNHPGSAVWASAELRANPLLTELALAELCRRFAFKFALVNSIESRSVLPALAHHFVPALSLVHEFASYTRPRDAFRDALYWSGEVVFSARVTMENAFAEYPDLGRRSAHILPQGRCLVPQEEGTDEQRRQEGERIRRLMRPKGLAEDSVVVLGAGFVQLRKGVDLFIECAARVVRLSGGEKCRFVWIGKGYDPDRDVGYSVYLADQVRRANLQEHVVFLDETSAIEAAYEEADMLLLSSRLDPLPNVAIDAMVHGVPVLCFDKTTGIADFLVESGLHEACVAGYLDSIDMACKVQALANSPGLRADIARRSQQAAKASFNMQSYVAQLESLALSVGECTRREQRDCQTILDSGLFRSDYACPSPQQGQRPELEVRAYVRAWASGIGRRKPYPGFHPGIYQEQHGLSIESGDPFAHYLRAGRPDGSWNSPVIEASATPSVLPGQRVALHVHVHYPELLSGIVERLALNKVRPDLFISINREEVRGQVERELQAYGGRVVEIALVPNRGRDIGPFVSTFLPGLLQKYDVIGHLHTKKSVDVKDARMGQSWYRFLLENLIGGVGGPMMDRIMARLAADPSIGMVFPDDPHIVGWGSNRVQVEALLGAVPLPEHLNFPVGSMFWARGGALSSLRQLNLGYEDYPDEPLPYDGTVLHAIERLFAVWLGPMGLRSATTNVESLTR